MQAVPLIHRLDGKRIFEWLLAWLSNTSRLGRRLLSTRRLQWQMLWLVLATLLAATWPLLQSPGEPGPGRELLALSPAFAMLWVVGAVCALAAAWQAKYHRLAALVLAGGAGLCVCLTFLWFSAPDLALTQLAVEVVTTILILLGLRWLPRRDANLPAAAPHALAARLRRLRDLLIALAAGVGMAWLALAMMNRPLPTAPRPSSWNAH